MKNFFLKKATKGIAWVLVGIMFAQPGTLVFAGTNGSEGVATRHFADPYSFTAPGYMDDGFYSHLNPYFDPEQEFLAARSSPAFAMGNLAAAISLEAAAGMYHLFGATRSTSPPGQASYGNVTIEGVRVLYGGQHQARYRDQVGLGHTVYQGESGHWYTTSRQANLMDGRSFTIRTLIANTQDLSGQSFLGNISYSFGELPLSAWAGHTYNFNEQGVAVGVAGHFNNPDNPFISLINDNLFPNGDGTYTLETTIQFRSPYLPANPAGVNIPWEGYRGQGQAGFPLAMRHVLGVFDLAIYAGGQLVGSLPIHLNLYDDFHLWHEIDTWARALQTEAGEGNTINNRYVNVSSLGQSHWGNELWSVVIAANAGAVADYFERTRPRMTGSLEDLLELRAEVESGVHHRLPIYFHNIHPDEVTGVDAQLIMVEQLIRSNYLVFETVPQEQTFGLTDPAMGFPWIVPASLDDPLWEAIQYVGVARGELLTRDDTTTVTIPVAQALEHFIFIFVPTNNPDGHYGMRRANAYGFDLNRDAAYQTQIENILVVKDVLRWSPLAMLEFHGHVAHLLIEPTTGPHNPNYEYDLLQPHMLAAAHAMGRAAISGAYYRYVVPAEHGLFGWDDGGPMYMPIFIMLFGILGFTLEIPHTNQDSLDANIAMGWAFVDHALENFDELFLNKLEYKRRGLTNADYAHLVDHFFTNPFTIPATVLGRYRTPGQSFFPDYWVIPTDPINQRNILEAYTMAAFLERHYVDIKRANMQIAHGGVVVPVDSFVIDMRQAHRGFVNNMLEVGYDASFFTSMYAEITMNFPDLRGFDAFPVWVPGMGALRQVEGIVVPEPPVPWTTPYIVIRNNNQDATRLVNSLLADGSSVFMLTADYNTARNGDFVVSRSYITDQHLYGRFIEAIGLHSRPLSMEQLVQPRLVILAGGAGAGQGLFSPIQFIMRDLGFDYTWVISNDQLAGLNLNQFDVLVSHNQNWPSIWDAVNDYGMPAIFVQTSAATAQETLAQNILDNLFYGRGGGFNNITASREGTFLATYSSNSLMTAYFDRANTAYLIAATGFYEIPTGTNPLITIAPGQFTDVFLGGWWQGEANQANIPGRTVAFTGNSNNGVPVTVFGTNIFNRAHTQVYHNMFATAVFMHAAGIAD
ncbi:MAG: hypothetical protein FWG63_10130 [Defluviitaleaceae bacterium]|nr:hypothetical protein [Defluviitaleaceae bacterium]